MKKFLFWFAVAERRQAETHLIILDSVQKKLEFQPKGTATWEIPLLARPLRGLASGISQVAVIFYTLREPFLNETATDSPRRRSLTLAAPQKSFLFLLKEKIGRAQNRKCEENFFAVFCSQRAGRRGFASGSDGSAFLPPTPSCRAVPA